MWQEEKVLVRYKNIESVGKTIIIHEGALESGEEHQIYV